MINGLASLLKIKKFQRQWGLLRMSSKIVRGAQLITKVNHKLITQVH